MRQQADSPAALDERARDLLDFEASWTTHAGAKASAIRERFGWSTTRYYQVLNVLIDSEAALQYDPLLVHRLQRIREGSVDRRGQGSTLQ